MFFYTKCLMTLVLFLLVVPSHGTVVLPKYSDTYTVEDRDMHFRNFVIWDESNESSAVKNEHAYQTVMYFWYKSSGEARDVVLSVLDQVSKNENHPKCKIASEILSDYCRPDELERYNAKMPSHLHAHLLMPGEVIPYDPSIDKKRTCPRKWSSNKP